MGYNKIQQQSTVSLLVKKFSLQNIFIPFFLIFTSLCIFVVGYLVITRTLANPYEMFSYFFVSASFILFLKVFTITYANALYSITNKSWVVLGVNLVFFGIQIFLGAFASFSLTDSTFILYPLQYLLIAGGLFYLQNLIDDNFKILNLALWAVLIYLLLYGLTLYRVFDSDARLWNVSGILALLVELFLFFFAIRKFVKNIC